MLNNFVPNLVDLLLSRFHFKDHNIELEKKERKNKKKQTNNNNNSRKTKKRKDKTVKLQFKD